MYEYLYSILPEGVKKRYSNVLKYTDIKVQTDKFVGFLILFGLGFSFTISFVLFNLLLLSTAIFFLVFLGLYFGIEIIIYGILLLSVDSKGKFVENILPDALQLMAMNIRSGMTTDRALILAARPEFGPLQKELSKAGKRMMSGGDVKESLLQIPNNIKSDILDRTMNLIVEGVQSGGEISELLEHTAEDIRNTKMVRQEVQSSIMMYSIFIFFAAAIGAPLLFGISTFLVEVLGSQISQFDVSDVDVQGPIQIGRGGLEVSSDFLMLFTIASLVITSIFAGIIMGIINKGDEKQGLKYIPVLLVISIIVFFLSRSFVEGLFPAL
jgi:archaeal flagellar protein FlaJ